MTTYTIAEIATRIVNTIESPPSYLTASSNAIIQQFVEYGAIRIENYSGVSIDNSVIAEKYLAALVAYGAAMSLSYMTGEGVNFDYKIGELSVKKSGDDDATNRQLLFWSNQFNEEMKIFGKKLRYKVTVN